MHTPHLISTNRFMKFQTYFLFLVLISLFSIRSGETQMESKTLIKLLNYSNTLVQNGEIKFINYSHFPTHPDDVGKEHGKLIESWERQLRENPPKSKNPTALRKKILGYLEEEKKYGEFRETKEFFTFLAGNLIFQKHPQSTYRMEVISRFEKYPSLGSMRFFNGGGLFCVFSNGTNSFLWSPPNQFAKDRRIGRFEEREGTINVQVSSAREIPPNMFIDESKSEIRTLEKNTTSHDYIITYYPDEERKVIFYVRIKSGLPEIYRREHYYKGESPKSDADGYWLGLVKMYSDFERVETLNISVPKVREQYQFRRVDGFIRYHSIVIIQEMDFNLDLPPNFFDLGVTELTDDNDKHEKNRDGVKKEEHQETQE